MKSSPFSPFVAAILLATLILAGCQAQKTTTGSSAKVDSTVSGQPEVPPLPGYPAGDSIDWSTVPEEYRPAPASPDSRELPGERLGLTGPIIADGGSGRNAYIAVYDPAGVLVGGILKKEAEENPEALRLLFEEAFNRSQIQNRFALEKMRENGALDR